MVGWVRDVGDEGSSLVELRVWAHKAWNLEGNLNLWCLGKNPMLRKFKRAYEAEKAFKKGMRVLQNMLLGLKRWNPSIGCVCPRESEKEA